MQLPMPSGTPRSTPWQAAGAALAGGVGLEGGGRAAGATAPAAKSGNLRRWIPASASPMSLRALAAMHLVASASVMEPSLMRQLYRARSVIVQLGRRLRAVTALSPSLGNTQPSRLAYCKAASSAGEPIRSCFHDSSFAARNASARAMNGGGFGGLAAVVGICMSERRLFLSGFGGWSLVLGRRLIAPLGAFLGELTHPLRE